MSINIKDIIGKKAATFATVALAGFGIKQIFSPETTQAQIANPTTTQELQSSIENKYTTIDEVYTIDTETLEQLKEVQKLEEKKLRYMAYTIELVKSIYQSALDYTSYVESCGKGELRHTPRYEEAIQKLTLIEENISFGSDSEEVAYQIIDVLMQDYLAIHQEIEIYGTTCEYLNLGEHEFYKDGRIAKDLYEMAETQDIQNLETIFQRILLSTKDVSYGRSILVETLLRKEIMSDEKVVALDHGLPHAVYHMQTQNILGKYETMLPILKAGNIDEFLEKCLGTCIVVDETEIQCPGGISGDINLRETVQQKNISLAEDLKTNAENIYNDIENIQKNVRKSIEKTYPDMEPKEQEIAIQEMVDATIIDCIQKGTVFAILTAYKDKLPTENKPLLATYQDIEGVGSFDLSDTNKDATMHSIEAVISLFAATRGGGSRLAMVAGKLLKLATKSKAIIAIGTFAVEGATVHYLSEAWRLSLFGKGQDAINRDPTYTYLFIGSMKAAMSAKTLALFTSVRIGEKISAETIQQMVQKFESWNGSFAKIVKETAKKGSDFSFEVATFAGTKIGINSVAAKKLQGLSDEDWIDVFIFVSGMKIGNCMIQEYIPESRAIIIEEQSTGKASILYLAEKTEQIENTQTESVCIAQFENGVGKIEINKESDVRNNARYLPEEIKGTFIEMGQNAHRYQEEGNNVQRPSISVTGTTETGWTVTTRNAIAEEEVAGIEQKIATINTYSYEQLAQRQRDVLNDGQGLHKKGGAGLGFIKIASRITNAYNILPENKIFEVKTETINGVTYITIQTHIPPVSQKREITKRKEMNNARIQKLDEEVQEIQYSHEKYDLYDTKALEQTIEKLKKAEEELGRIVEISEQYELMATNTKAQIHLKIQQLESLQQAISVLGFFKEELLENTKKKYNRKYIQLLAEDFFSDAEIIIHQDYVDVQYKENAMTSATIQKQRNILENLKNDMQALETADKMMKERGYFTYMLRERKGINEMFKVANEIRTQKEEIQDIYNEFTENMHPDLYKRPVDESLYGDYYQKVSKNVVVSLKKSIDNASKDIPNRPTEINGFMSLSQLGTGVLFDKIDGVKVQELEKDTRRISFWANGRAVGYTLKYTEDFGTRYLEVKNHKVIDISEDNPQATVRQEKAAEDRAKKFEDDVNQKLNGQFTIGYNIYNWELITEKITSKHKSGRDIKPHDIINSLGNKEVLKDNFGEYITINEVVPIDNSFIFEIKSIYPEKTGGILIQVHYTAATGEIESIEIVTNTCSNFDNTSFQKAQDKFWKSITK